MDINSFNLLVLLSIITHIVRTIYEIMKHKKIIVPGKISFVIIFTNMALLWTSWFQLCGLDQNVLTLPSLLHYFGIMLVFAGLIFFLTALFTIKTLETYEGNLITKGIYSRIRHPMYLGFIFWLIGVPIYFGGIFSLIISIPFIINVLFWRYLEEIELLKRFPDYKSYRSKTFF